MTITWQRHTSVALPNRLLVDTTVWYALASPGDQFHGQARTAYDRVIDRNQEVWTTSYVLVETIALVHRRLGFDLLASWERSTRGGLRVYWVDGAVHNEAWGRFVANQGSGLSFVDWTTVVAAGRLGAHVFTFDQGFAREGVPVVPR